MRWGVSTQTFRHAIAAGRMDVDALLAWARERGAEAIQFGENLPWPSSRSRPKGMVVESGCRGIGPHLLAHLELARRHGSGFVRVALDDGDDRPSVEEATNRLAPYAEAYRQAGIVLAVDHPGRFSARTLRALVERLGLGVGLDVANSQNGLEAIETVIAELGPYVVNLRVDGVEGPSFLRRLPRLQSVTLEPSAPPERELELADAGASRLRSLVRGEHDRLVLGGPRRPKTIVVRAGRLTAEFERDSGWLRSVKRDEDEIVRALYGAVRTVDGETPSPRIADLVVEKTAEGFAIGYTASVEPALPFRWQARIVGEADRITFELEGETTAECEAARMGLRLLHALTFRDLPCTVVHSDGAPEATRFPDFWIAPEPPFRDVRAIEAPGLRVEFVGAAFETEDARNEADASFQTHPRSPNGAGSDRLKPGDRIRQSAILTFSDAEFEPRTESFPMGGKLPSVGVFSPSSAFPDSAVAHVATSEGGTVRLVDRHGRRIVQPRLFTPTGFAEQNRDHPKDVADAMFALSPPARASDWRTIVESLEGMEDCLRTAMGWAHAVHLGPVTLDRHDAELRVRSLAAAGWLLGVVAIVAEANSHGRAPSVTFGHAESFGSPDGPSPIVHVLADLDEFQGAIAEPVIFPHPQDRVVLGVDRNGRRADLVANLTGRPVRDHNLPKGRLRILDASNVRLATLDPAAWRHSWRPFPGGDLILPPYAYARVDAEAPVAEEGASRPGWWTGGWLRRKEDPDSKP